MELARPYYLEILKEALSQKQRSNPQYSLRAYARDIGLNPGTLSQIIQGKRQLPLKDSKLVSKKLKLTPKEQSLFMESLRQGLIKDSPEFTLMLQDESYYKVLAEWEHYAVLELFHLNDFHPTVSETAIHLGIDEERAQEVVNNLMLSGLIVMEASGLMKSQHSNIKSTEDITSRALKDSHKETLSIGMEKLDEIEIDLRDFSSSTIAIDIEKIPEAKALIREFRQKFAALHKDGNKKHIYQLAIQYYPLSQIKKQKKQETQQ